MMEESLCRLNHKIAMQDSNTAAWPDKYTNIHQQIYFELHSHSSIVLYSGDLCELNVPYNLI